MKKSLIAVTVAVALSGAAYSALAQQKPAAGGVAVTASEPGKATAVSVAEISAQVMAIDKATRTVTLKGPQGKVVDVVAGEEVRNFDQIKLGDMVVVRYAEALTLELRKTKGDAKTVTVDEGAARAKAGERPGVAGGRTVTAIAEVTAVDPKASTISLKGPRGNVYTLKVQNPEQFKVVKKGDQVEVTYTEAMAVSVEPGKKEAAKAKK